MFDSSSGGWRAQLPPVTRNLIVINVLIWLVEILAPNGFGSVIVDKLGLHLFGADKFNPVQLITYMFVHDQHNPLHLLFNMFTLWMFGRLMEQVWGAKRFLLFYMVCGVGAALVQEAVWGLTWHQELVESLARLNGLTFDNMDRTLDAALASRQSDALTAVAFVKNSMCTVGASGAVFGLLLGFAFVFPNLPLYLFFIPVPIKAKYMVIGYAVLEFYLGISGQQSLVAHFAHLGGMLFGLILLLIWKKNGTLRGGRFY